MPNPPYNKKRRRTAALDGWKTRRANELIRLKLPDYGEAQDNPDQPPALAERVDVGSVLPVTRDTLAGGIAEWEDDVFDVDENGYHLMRTCPCVVSPINKLAVRTAALDLVVVGEGARAEALQEIVDQANGKVELIEYLTWARVEGVRYCQIKKKRSLEGGDIFVIPDFIGGGRKKQKAGGQLQWDGTRIMQIMEATGVTERQPEELPRGSFMIFRPGAGSNPEGDLDFGLACYRLAYNWNEAQKNMDKFTELFGVPMRILERNMDKTRPTEVQGLLTDAVVKLQQMQNDRAIGLTSDDVVKLLQPTGRPLADMIEYAQYLEGVVHMMILLNTLTSDTKDSGPAGSSTVHLSEEDKAVFYNATLIEQPLNSDLVPWIYKQNPDMPELLEGESEPFLKFQPMGQRESEKVAVADEMDLTGEITEAPLNPGFPAVEPALEPALEPAAPEILLSAHPDTREAATTAESVLTADGTDHTHTIVLDEAGSGTSSTDPSAAAGEHSHEVIANEVQPAGTNNHTHGLEQSVTLDHKAYHKKD